jgi:nitrite reductase/ring-hydroxylating ferredoxin subunit
MIIMRSIARYIDDLVRSRRPRRFAADEKDRGLVETAITLRAARPGSGAPRDEFVLELHKQLAAELDPLPPRRVTGAPHHLNRRRAFLRATVVGGTLAGAGAAGAAIDHALTMRAAAPAPTLSPDHGAWLTVATSGDLAEGAVRAFTAGAVTGFVRRAGSRLQAVSGVCTHQGCRLDLATGAKRLVCPCHGAMFSLDGAVLTHRLPLPLTALPRLPVREADGEVQVYVSPSL